MGLDISYFKRLKRADPQPSEDDFEAAYDKYCYVAVNPDFSQQADGLETGFYKGQRVGGFRAGSYSGYNEWRAKLSELALGLTANEVWTRDGRVEAFGELINFSDCEGAIGAKTSAKLAKDFKKYASKIKKVSENWFWELYQEWMKAFQTASHNGAVTFH